MPFTANSIRLTNLSSEIMMYRNFKSLIMTALLLGAFYASSAIAQPSIIVGSATGQQGDTVTVPVSFENDGTVVGMNFNIEYDPAIFPSVDVEAACNGNDLSPG